MGLNTDPVVRYTAGSILVLAFLGAMAVAMHGYWVSPDYVPPAVVVWILGSAVTGAAGALGLHVGSVSTLNGVATGARTAGTPAKGGE